MNSKIICTVLTGALTLTLFTGCGTEDGLDTMESNLQTETESETYDPEMAEIQNEMSSEYANEVAADSLHAEEEESETETMSEYKKFDADPGWKDIKSYDIAIQVDDELYVAGCTADEIMKKVNSSSVKYETDYVPDGMGAADITVKRDGIDWFVIRTADPSADGNGKRSECIVTNIYEKYDASPFCHYIDGRSYDDILLMNYEDAKALTDNVFKPSDECMWIYRERSNQFGEYDYLYDQDTYKNVMIIGYECDGMTHTEDQFPVMPTSLSDKGLEAETACYFVIDKDTSKVINFVITRNGGLSDRKPTTSETVSTEEACSTDSSAETESTTEVR